MIKHFDIANNHIGDLCAQRVDLISRKFNNDLEFKNFIDCIAYQVVSCYLGIKLFDNDLTLDSYINSDKYSRLFNMLVKNITRALKLQFTKLDFSNLNYVIIHYVNYIYVEYILSGYVDYPPFRVFSYELRED